MDKIIVLLTALLLPHLGYAAYTVQGGKLLNTKEVATFSVQEHYSAASDAYQNKNWQKLVEQATIVVKNFSNTPFEQEAFFYLGVGCFHLKDYEKANKNFSAYLKRQTPVHFEEAIAYKFDIAEQYRIGAKKRLMGWQSMPAWLPAGEDALSIYDEVITALPHHDLGARALFGKATLLFKEQEYKTSIETLQMLIRRFPKHPLAPEGYLEIGKIYLEQAKAEYPDPDLLDLAEINLRKFKHDFPGEQRMISLESTLLEMQELYAESLYEIGQFYERTKKAAASQIYYNQVIRKYPQTQIADHARKRMAHLQTAGSS